MIDNEHETADNSLTMRTALQGLLGMMRVLCSTLGIVTIIIGLVYATRTVDLIYSTLYAPEAFGLLLDKWTAAMGGSDFSFSIDGTPQQTARLAAIIFIGGATIVLAWLPLAFVSIGAKVVSWTLSDREAIKKLLKYTFGDAKKLAPRKEITEK